MKVFKIKNKTNLDILIDWKVVLNHSFKKKVYVDVQLLMVIVKKVFK